MFLYFTYSTKDLRFIWEIYLKPKSPPSSENLSTKEEEKESRFVIK